MTRATASTKIISKTSSQPTPVGESSPLFEICSLDPREESRESAILKLIQSGMGGTDLKQLLNETSLLVARALPCDMCAIFELLSSEESPVLRSVAGKGGALVCEASYPLEAKPKRELQAEIVLPVQGAIARSTSGRLLTLRPKNSEIKSVAIVEIYNSRGVTGLLEVHSSSKREFSKEDSAFLFHLADALGVIMERRRMEETLRQSEARYRMMLEGSEKVFFYEHSADLIVKYASPSLFDILGYTPEETVGQRCDKYFAGDPSDELIVGLTLAALKDGTPPPTYLSVLRHKDGRKVILETVEAPIKSNGEVVGMQGFARDITERKLSEKHLEERTAYLNALIVHNPLGIVVLDTQNRVEMCNPAFENIFQFRQEEIRGIDLDDLISPPDSRDEVSDLTRITQGGEAVQFIGFRKRRDGSLVNVELHGVPLIVEGERVGCFAIYQDISSRRKAEESLRLLSGRLLQVQDEERRRMARDLHDTSVQDLVALSMKLGALSASCAGALAPADAASLAQSVDLADQCARELRTLSYLLHPPLLDEAGITSAVKWYAEGYSRRSGIRVSLDNSMKCGRLPRDMELTLFRIVQESLTNVHKHSGGCAATIRLYTRAKRVHLEVSDDGRGIPPAILKSLSAADCMMGVGIAGMRERVKQLGGRLELRSESGTTVKVVMPLPARGQ